MTRGTNDQGRGGAPLVGKSDVLPFAGEEEDKDADEEEEEEVRLTAAEPDACRLFSAAAFCFPDRE